MKKVVFVVCLLVSLAIPLKSEAYIGAGLGVVDEDEFGYGLLFGVQLPLNLAIDAQLVGFADSGTVDRYWLQGNLDLAYDFHNWIKSLTAFLELHPYVKAGFTYAGLFIDTANIDSEASHGPGFNFGVGIDWKVLPLLTIGLDLTNAIVNLEGVTVNNVVLAADETTNVFNIMATVKFFAY